MSWPKEIVVIGAGNVAWHLGKHLVVSGFNVVHVHARSEHNAHLLATELACAGGNQVSDIPDKADLYLVAVSDASIKLVAKSLFGQIHQDSLVLHTSGATPASVFQPFFTRYGVFYPLQTFSKKRRLDFSKVPLCICTNSTQDLEKVKLFAEQLSAEVHEVSDEQRLHLHLAAIYVNNFTNYLQYIGESLLAEQGLSTEMLRPLLTETVAKLKGFSARDAQTGPAIRGDESTLNRHLSQLESHPHWQALYKLLSDGIQKDLT